MSVDLSRSDIVVAEQFLNRSDIVVVFEQMGRKAVSESMATGVLVYSRLPDRSLDCLLDRTRRGVMPARQTVVAAWRDRRRREDILPAEFRVGVLVFAGKRERQRRTTKAACKILFVESSDTVDVELQIVCDRVRKNREAILGAFAVAHGDLVQLKVDVLDAQAEAFGQTQTASVQERGNNARRSFKIPDHGARLFLAEDNRKTLWPLCSDDVIDFRQINAEDLFVKEQERIERDILGRCGHRSVNREMGQVIADFFDAHFRRMAFTVIKDEIPDVVNVGFLRTVALVTGPDQVPYLIKQFRFCHKSCEARVRRSLGEENR